MVKDSWHFYKRIPRNVTLAERRVKFNNSRWGFNFTA